MAPRTLLTATAALLGIAGIALLFLPTELQGLAGTRGGVPLPATVLQLWGAALLGLAATDWVGRGLILGGIYGRALVLGNLAHSTVGALAALRAALDHPGSAPLWAAVTIFGGLAVAFARLLRTHPGPDIAR